jgi:hypothetical protein
MDRRSQTPADYLIGISLLLTTIFGVFAFVPTVFDPFEQPTEPAEHAMADRLADDLVEKHTALSKEATVDLDALERSLDGGMDETQSEAGIPDWKYVNVTVRSDRTWVLREGPEWHGDSPAGTSSRTVASRQPACRDGCTLIVRVWGR